MLRVATFGAVLAGSVQAQNTSSSIEKVTIPYSATTTTVVYESLSPAICSDDATTRPLRFSITPKVTRNSPFPNDPSTYVSTICQPSSGVQITVPISGVLCGSIEPIIFEYAYQEPGVKRLTLSSASQNHNCGFAINTFNGASETFTFAIGPPSDYPLSISLDFESGTTPMVVTATLNRFPPNYTGVIYWEAANVEDAPTFDFNPNQLTSTVTLRDVGLHSYTLANEGTRYISEDDFLVLRGNTVSVTVAPNSTGKPFLLSRVPLETLNTPGNEYNARLSADESRIYYLSDWSGRSEIMRAERPTLSGPFAESQRLLFAGSEPISSFGGLINFEMAADESAMLVDIQEGLRRRILLSHRQGSDIEGRPQFGTPRPIDARRLEPWADNLVSLGLDDRSHLYTNGAKFLLPAIQPTSANGHLAIFDVVDETPTGFRCQFPSTVYADQLPRLTSSDKTVRYWMWNGIVHGAADLDHTESAIVKYGPAVAAERYALTGLKPTLDTLVGIGQVSTDGARLYIHSDDQTTFTGFDLYQAEFLLPPDRTAIRAELTGHLTSTKPKPNPLVLDANADVKVDVGDMP